MAYTRLSSFYSRTLVVVLALLTHFYVCFCADFLLCNYLQCAQIYQYYWLLSCSYIYIYILFVSSYLSAYVFLTFKPLVSSVAEMKLNNIALKIGVNVSIAKAAGCWNTIF
jgi:hypothetical protein